MILFPDCKINIGLDVLARRPDGYHDIETVMIPVTGLCDILEIVPAAGLDVEFRVTGEFPDGNPEDNLCMKAYRLMASRCAGIEPVRMHLHKVIPYGAGLGGGSSDAAFVIKGLDRLFGLSLGVHMLESLASELGSDTAFFIRNIPSLSSGRGEILEPIEIPDIAGMTLLIVKPDIAVGTAQAYSGVLPMIPSVCLTDKIDKNPTTWRDSIVNSFEKTIFSAYPQIAGIKDKLYCEGAVYASMSGSGSAVYGLFGHPVLNAQQLFPGAFVYQQII